MNQTHPAARLSVLEAGSVIGGVYLLVAAVVAAVAGADAGGLARAIGTVGLAGIVIAAASCGIRQYRAGLTASLPTSVAKVSVRTRPGRGIAAVTVALALVLPLGASVAVLALVSWAWLPLAGVLVLGGVGAIASWSDEDPGDASWSADPAAAVALLERLCMRADVPVPKLVVVPGDANAWTAGGRIHVTPRLLKLLDDAELEAVLAHEVAHLANRDAAVMDICSAPSRVLLAFANSVALRFTRGTFELARDGGAALAGHVTPIVVVLMLVFLPAYVIGWIARLSVLGMSRAREFSADAAAAALTGRPSALASALMKLERRREWAPRADLRRTEAHAVLCIVGTGRAGPGRLFSTHPSTEARVRRLEETETRIQAGPYRTRP